MRKQRDQAADLLSRRLDRAADIIPEVRRHLAEQRHYARYNYRGGEQEGGRAKGTHSDPTARLALNVTHCDDREAHIDDALTTLNVAVNLLEKACSTALGYRVPADQRPHDGRTAFEQDGEPICHAASCDQPVSSYLRTDNSLGYRMEGDYGGLCDSHRAKAWRDARGAA